MKDEIIRFRKMTPQDSTAMHLYLSDPEVSRYIGWPLTTTVEQTVDYLAKLIERDRVGTHIYASVEDIGRDEIIGAAMIFNIDREAGRGEIGYVLRRDCWGTGIGSRIVSLICQSASQDFGFHKLQAAVVDANGASARVLEKNGFILEGRQMDFFRIEDKYYDCLLYGKIL